MATQVSRAEGGPGAIPSEPVTASNGVQFRQVNGKFVERFKPSTPAVQDVAQQRAEARPKNGDACQASRARWGLCTVA
jgi:hypothetical protein